MKMAGSSALYRWLRKVPQPHHLEVVDGNGETHRIELTPGRSCWLTAEETIETMTDAASVRAFNADHKLLRAISIARAEDESDPKTAPKAAANSISVNGRELAAIIEAQGRAVREAYEAGSQANAAANEALVGIVDTLSQRFADALNNINSLAVSAAEQRIASAGGEGADPADAMVQNLMQLALLKAGAPAAGAPANGTAEKKKGP
jgi:hypothetical protein